MDSSFAGIKTDWPTANRQQPGSIVRMRLSSRKFDSTPEFRNTPGCRYARCQSNNSHIGRTAPAESFAGCAPALSDLSGHGLCQFQRTAHSPGSKRTGQPRTDSSPGLSFVCGFLPENATVHQNFGTRLAADTHAASQITAISAAPRQRNRLPAVRQPFSVCRGTVSVSFNGQLIHRDQNGLANRIE